MLHTHHACLHTRHKPAYVVRKSIQRRWREIGYMARDMAGDERMAVGMAGNANTACDMEGNECMWLCDNLTCSQLWYT
jgi:hypothetical protein